MLEIEQQQEREIILNTKQKIKNKYEPELSYIKTTTTATNKRYTCFQ